MADAEEHAPSIETTQLGPFIVPRVWTGLWQLSSPAWGTAPTGRIKREMMRHVKEGYTAFADHYGSAEILFGQFRQTLESPDTVVGATKWCVFATTEITREVVEEGVRERMERMRTERVDLLQFHWQNYDDKAYLKALDHLRDLQAEGTITAIGLCNFDTIRTDEIFSRRLGAAVDVMFLAAVISKSGSLMLIRAVFAHRYPTARRDGRRYISSPLPQSSSRSKTQHLLGPKRQYDRLARGSGEYTLTQCGGFLADKWLGAPEPDAYRETMTPSQRKYLDMIKSAWGTWTLFQSLLRVLRTIGDRHGGVSIANVSTRWVLQHDFVGAVIIGARLGVSEHTNDNLQTFSFRLSEGDLAEIESVLDESNGRNLVRTIGDCGSEYR
ncbi:hypothetical protein FRC07_003655 [Ceratobasidium sp. 392]|nr:hypothetical protein FRC07_003655 [Ceratobasidium sp. 392]